MKLRARLLTLTLLAIVVGGCAKQATTESSTSASPGGSAMGAGSGDVGRGKSIFAANCAQCHGPGGTEGGVGPSLKNEKSRKDLAKTIQWIKNPEPPMPKLFPSPLGEKDVADVAAFVQSL